MTGLTEPSPRYCFCRNGPPSWRLAAGDAHCSGCGRRLADAVPRDLPLGPGRVQALACYLRRPAAAAPGLVGMVGFRLTRPPGGRPRATWVAGEGLPLRVVGIRSPAPGEVEVGLACDAPPGTSPGLRGQGELVLDGLGEPMRFQVFAFAVDGLATSTRLVEQPGKPPAGPLLVLMRGASAVTNYLEFEPGAGVPARWEAIECGHTAVDVRPLDIGFASPVARAEVRWDPSRLDPSARVERVRFRLRLVGLPDRPFVQDVRWRLRRPLRGRPSVLVVPCLPEGQVEAFGMELTNADTEPVVLTRANSDRPWFRTIGPAASGSLRLNPGDRTTLDVILDARKFDANARAVQGRIEIGLANRGTQRFVVRVLAVRRARVMETPLLIDPGPGRVVMARFDPSRARLVYPTQSGDSGVTPEVLGLSSEEYAQAVYAGRGSDRVVRRLVVEAVALCRRWELWRPTRIRVCRHHWVPPGIGGGGVEFVDWSDLAFDRPADGDGGRPDVDIVVRIGAWEVDSVTPPDAQTGRPAGVVRLSSATDSPRPLGGVIAAFLEDILRPRRRPTPGPPAAWLRLACEGLIADHARGPAFAWRRLAHTWHRNVPEARQTMIDPRVAGGELARGLTELLVWVGRRAAVARAGPVSCSLLAPLFDGGQFKAVVKSAGEAVSVDMHGDQPDWIGCLAASHGPP